MNNKKLFLIALAMCALPLSASANHIHKWVDADGVTHFTDNAAHVPAQYREGSGLEVEDFSEQEEAAGSSSDSEDHGREMWSLVCSRCHHAGFGNKGDLIGLRHITIDAVTKFPKTAEEILPRLKSAASGHRSDMDQIDVSDEELLNVAKYLIELQQESNR